MAFLQNGSWVPDQSVAAQMTPQAVAPQMQNMMYQPQSMQTQQFQPQMQNYNQNMFSASPAMYNQNAVVAPQSLPAASSSGLLPDGPPNPGRPPQMQHQMPTQGSPYMPYPQLPMQSVTQSVNNANPQSVQNFLQSLNQSPQATQNNAWQNPMGTQGAGPQAGFQGFQQNGSAPQQNQWQGYSQNQQPSLGSYGNQATQGSPVSTQAAGQSNQVNQNGVGGAQQMGGVPGQPQYHPSDPSTRSNTYQQNLGATIQNGLSSASDINSKQNIHEGDGELQSFLDSLGVYSYEYKDPKYGQGRRISPMAQEIEKTSIGQAAISTNNEGYKIVDYGKLMGTQLAALALLNHKYKELESQLQEAIITGIKKGKK